MGTADGGLTVCPLKKSIPTPQPSHTFAALLPGANAGVISPSFRRGAAAERPWRWERQCPAGGFEAAGACANARNRHQTSAQGGPGPHTCPSGWRGHPAVCAIFSRPRAFLRRVDASARHGSGRATKNPPFPAGSIGCGGRRPILARRPSSSGGLPCADRPPPWRARRCRRAP
jgi:hypothetical protein